jgi:response regulator RpfG family c-di-GMP phosphodiesterase
MTPTHILEQQYDILHKKFEDRIPWKDMVINYQMAIDKSKNLDPKLVKEFFSKTKKFDEYRKQNLFNFLPYMKELADKFEVETW